MKTKTKGRVTIPLAIRKKHGLLPQCPVEFIDQADGVLVVRAGKSALAPLLRGGKIKARTEDWLRLTRGDA